MEKVTVWTKQHKAVLEEIEATGRYIVKKEYVAQDFEEYSNLVMELYEWLSQHAPNYEQRPQDANYPIWVSLQKEGTMLKTEDTVLIELSIEKSLITMINVNKWSSILNYSYIPENEEDLKDHKEMLAQYGVSDASAYMSQFYPQIKRKIIDSWHRLFDDSIMMHNSNCYGNIWEVKKEWITNVVQ